MTSTIPFSRLKGYQFFLHADLTASVTVPQRLNRTTLSNFFQEPPLSATSINGASPVSVVSTLFRSLTEYASIGAFVVALGGRASKCKYRYE